MAGANSGTCLTAGAQSQSLPLGPGGPGALAGTFPTRGGYASYTIANP